MRLSGLAHNSPEYIHTVIEALNLAFADREAYLGDPDFVTVPVEGLLSADYATRQGARIDPTRAFGEMPRPGRPAGSESLSLAHLDHLRPTPNQLTGASPDTIFCSVIDREGNVYSATLSDNTHDTPIIPGTGLAVSSRGSQSRLDPLHPSVVAPLKRPRLTPNPAMVVTKDGGVMPFGTPGGDVQIQAMLQVMLNILHFGMPVQDAIEAPRVASYSFPSTFAPYEYFPGRLAVESRIPVETRDALAAMGHEVKPWPGTTWLAGSVEVVLSDPVSGLKHAGADPRRPAYAIAT
jgi:gamma-glutamyltranspeptidase/glutathione hydrolase